MLSPFVMLLQSEVSYELWKSYDELQRCRVKQENFRIEAAKKLQEIELLQQEIQTEDSTLSFNFIIKFIILRDLFCPPIKKITLSYAEWPSALPLHRNGWIKP